MREIIICLKEKNSLKFISPLKKQNLISVLLCKGPGKVGLVSQSIIRLSELKVKY